MNDTDADLISDVAGEELDRHLERVRATFHEEDNKWALRRKEAVNRAQEQGRPVPQYDGYSSSRWTHEAKLLEQHAREFIEDAGHKLREVAHTARSEEVYTDTVGKFLAELDATFQRRFENARPFFGVVRPPSLPSFWADKRATLARTIRIEQSKFESANNASQQGKANIDTGHRAEMPGSPSSSTFQKARLPQKWIGKTAADFKDIIDKAAQLQFEGKAANFKSAIKVVVKNQDFQWFDSVADPIDYAYKRGLQLYDIGGKLQPGVEPE